MPLMTIFSTIGPRFANEPPNDNNNDLSYISNINVNHNKFSFYVDQKQQLLIISLLNNT